MNIWCSTSPSHFFLVSWKILLLLKHTQTASLKVTKTTHLLTKTISVQISSTSAMKRLRSQEGFVNFRGHGILSQTLEPSKFRVLSLGVRKALQIPSSSLFWTRTLPPHRRTLSSRTRGRSYPGTPYPSSKGNCFRRGQFQLTQKCIFSSKILL